MVDSSIWYAVRLDIHPEPFYAAGIYSYQPSVLRSVSQDVLELVNLIEYAVVLFNSQHREGIA